MIKTITVLLCSIFAGNYLYAQQVLTLQEVVKFALENKAEAKKSRLELENAQYQIDEVRAGALPQITGAGTLTYNPMLQQSALPGELLGRPGETIMVAFGQKWQSNATLTVNQKIFDQSLFTGLKAARTTKEFYVINNQLTEEQLIEKVANAYYEVFQSTLQLQTIQNNLDNTTKTHKVISGLVEAGLAKKIDLDRISVNINNLEAQKQQVINSNQLRENALKFAIGMDISQDIELPKETFDVNSKILQTESNLSNRTEVLLLQKQTELLDLNKKSIVAGYYPSLSFTGNLGYLGMGDTFPIFSSNSGVQWAGFSGLGLNLSIPIFNGGATKSRVNQANIQIRQLQVDMEDTKLGLNLAHENAKSQIKNSLLTINSNRLNVNLAKEVLDNTENNYRNGLATLTELLDAETAYAEAQNNLNTSLLNYKVAEVQLIKSNGNLKSLVSE
ncbi:TolC family protein [Sphingobacterium alkalisoli]|uniref:TolC family protein n=1 Tax=Sphingobacterium alkalisoli TaxID=1874115 RepID=A0A4U0GXZ0_9SPHI|nr:TolC family protein [Sphingobacterium alkalisoli]TJY63534.1 TolC family protein [Sphingobacterium alkalisoli]